MIYIVLRKVRNITADVMDVMREFQPESDRIMGFDFKGEGAIAPYILVDVGDPVVGSRRMQELDRQS